MYYMKTTNAWIRLWRQPLIIGLLCIAGLIAALVGDGILDIIAWICLLYPLIRMSYHYWHKSNASVSI